MARPTPAVPVLCAALCVPEPSAARSPLADTFKRGAGFGRPVSQMAEASESEEQVDSPEDLEDIKLPVPDFDEEEYMAQEIEKAQLAVLNTGYGILLAGAAAVVDGYTGNHMHGWLTLLVGVAGLRGVYRLGGVTHHDWGAKEWIAAYFTLFFSFLAFWYVFSNPPF